MPRYRHDPSKNLVGFLVGPVMYAVRIDLVREIVNPLEVVALPRAPKTVRGVADYRGLVVPVIDLRERFGLPREDASRKTKWVVLDVSGAGLGPRQHEGARYAALVVDAVTDVFGYGADGVRPAPPLGEGDELRGIEGVTTVGVGAKERLVFVLDSRAFDALASAVLDDVPSRETAGAAR